MFLYVQLVSVHRNLKLLPRGGKAVHMLIRHSRNTAQKQWDETIVLVLGGISRLLRSFFPLLRILKNFWSGWQSLLHVVKNSILSGSKEVALAAINCLQSTILSHSPKGNLPLPYLQSVLEVYDSVLQKSANYSGDAAIKAKQEIIHGLGEIYVQAQELFDRGMYTQLLSVIDLAITEANVANQHFEAEFGHGPPMQRTVLEIIPMLSPPKHLSPMWFLFLQIVLQYLPRSESLLEEGEDAEKGNTTSQSPDSTKIPLVSNGSASVPTNRLHDSSRSSVSTVSVVVDSSHYLFAEKLIPRLVDLFLQAPAEEKYSIVPDIIQSLRR